MIRVAAVLLLPLLLSACSPSGPTGAGAGGAGTGAEVPRPGKLGLCVACHGIEGVSRIPGTPHIAGQDEIYLRKVLAEYRDGRRNGGPMNAAAGSLSQDDIDALAAWYAAQRWPGAPVSEEVTP